MTSTHQLAPNMLPWSIYAPELTPAQVALQALHRMPAVSPDLLRYVCCAGPGRLPDVLIERKLGSRLRVGPTIGLGGGSVHTPSDWRIGAGGLRGINHYDYTMHWLMHGENATRMNVEAQPRYEPCEMPR